MDILLLIGRILYGGLLAFMSLHHFTRAGALAGYAQAKGVPAPRLAVLGSGAALLLGGLSIVLGLWVPLGVLLIVAFFVPVTLMMHNFWAEQDPQTRQLQSIQFMKNATIVGAALMLLAIEAWPYSIQPHV